MTSLALLGRHDEMEAAAGIDGDPRPDQLITAVCRGNARSYVGDWAGATRDLSTVVEASRGIGISDFLSAAWANLAKVQYLTGDWDAARQNAQQAVEVVADTDQFWALSPVHSTAALVPARRGDWAAARTHVDVALAAARSHQEAMSIRYAGDRGGHAGAQPGSPRPGARGRRARGRELCGRDAPAARGARVAGPLRGGAGADRPAGGRPAGPRRARGDGCADLADGARWPGCAVSCR